MDIESQIRLIRRMHRDGVSPRSIAEASGLDLTFVHDVCVHEVFTDIGPDDEDEATPEAA